jgi:hypothetical protein
VRCGPSPVRREHPAADLQAGLTGPQRWLVTMLRFYQRHLCILIAFASLMIGVGAASALTPVTVKRCGYAVRGFYGKDAIYPWHMSCSQARTILAGAINPHARHINLTADGAATGDAGPILIDGRWWVCGGRMGFYFCKLSLPPGLRLRDRRRNHLEGSLHKRVRLQRVLGRGQLRSPRCCLSAALSGIALATGRRTQDSPPT